MIFQDLVIKMPATKDLDEMLKFLDVKLKENYSQVMEAELSIREKQKKIEALRMQLNSIRGPAKKLKRSIIIELQIQKPGNLDLSVSYLVKGASWQPIYDARANFEKSEVEFVSYGIVKQVTGEEWQDVEISLSTARPAVGGRMPYIPPWFLGHCCFGFEKLVNAPNRHTTEEWSHNPIDHLVIQLSASLSIVPSLNVEHLEHGPVHVETCLSGSICWDTVDRTDHQFDKISSTGFCNQVAHVDIGNTNNISPVTKSNSCFPLPSIPVSPHTVTRNTGCGFHRV